MYEHRKEIMQNVFLTYLPASKFKTSVLSAHLVTPLSRENASANALLPAVLRRGTMPLLYTSPSPRDGLLSRMPSSA